MIEAVLFDLDDTLLGNNMDRFLPHYFDLLGRYAADLLARDQFLDELMVGTQAMVTSTDTAVSNRDIFWQTFQKRTGMDPAELEPFFERFYREKFPQLQTVTEKRPIAAQLVHACFERNWKVVIATNPLFPEVAIHERLAWAGVPVDAWAYDLVTTYENMHATKPHTAYYREILSAIDTDSAAAVMVGDDWKNDIVPTSALGMKTYWIRSNSAAPPDPELVDHYGTLEQFYRLIQDGWLGS